MKKCSKESLSVLSSYVGLYLRHCTVGIYLYWGNLSVYTNSYFRSKLGPDPSIKTPWVISLVLLGMALGNIGVGYTTDLIGKKGSVMVGSLLLNAGVFLTYFSVQWSVMAVNMSMGICGGLGCGFLYCMTFVRVASLDPRNIGLITAVIASATSTGAGTLNQIITFYINPNNLSPDLLEQREKYFTQKEVLDKVPSVFLLIGCFNLCCQGASYLLVRPQMETGKGGKACAQIAKSVDNHYVELSHGGNDLEKDKLLTASTNDKCLDKKQHERKEEISTEKHDENMSLLQILKCRSFYVLWFSVICCDYSYNVLSNFYKSYAQTRIPDDRFLANLATAQLFTVILIRPLWAMFTDRCGVKLCMILLSSITSVASAFWYFTPMVSRWMYFLWTMLHMSSNSSLHLTFSIAAMKVFGKDNFSQSYGLVMSSTILLNLTAPWTMEYTLRTFGWFYLFFSTSCGLALCSILLTVFLPRK